MLPLSPRLRTRSYLFKSLLMPFLIPITSLLRLKVTSIILILRWKLRMANTPLRLNPLKNNLKRLIQKALPNNLKSPCLKIRFRAQLMKAINKNRIFKLLKA